MEDIRIRYYDNIKRVDNLLDIYENFLRGKGGGRRSIIKTDVIRSAVVFLHSALEDFLRGVLKEFLPYSDDVSTIDKIPLIGCSDIGRPEKFYLGRLIRYKGKKVEDIITESIEAFLKTVSFNDTTEIVSWLRSVDINISNNDDLSLINNMIKRRHKIVHEVDSNITGGKGQHRAISIDTKTVKFWRDATTRFVEEVVKHIDNDK